MKNYKIKFLIPLGVWLSISALMMAVGSIDAPAQTGQPAAVESRQDVQTIKLTALKGKGKDKNIRGKSSRNKTPRQRAAGETVCNIEIKNNTKYFVYVYLNGRERGTVSSNSVFKTIDDVGRFKVGASANCRLPKREKE